MKAVSRLVLALSPVLLSCFVWAAGTEAPGVPNFQQVSQNIYRGGQPSDRAWEGLAKLGIKIVIDLRRPDEHSTSNEKRLVEAAGMRYLNLPMKGVVAPPNEEVTQALALMEASENAAVFVHCKRGSDRTGTVVACYRISHDRWQNDAALREAKSHGMSSLQLGMKWYVKNYRAPLEAAATTTGVSTGSAVQQSVAVHP